MLLDQGHHQSIRILPPELTRLIAAGELVTRPLDVVRELIENALDADATRLEIILMHGGLEEITVRDNGKGIPETSVPLTATRHATSKLDPATDELEGILQRIETLGFRGEALWAISQAGELTLITRPATQLGASQLRVLPYQTEAEVTRIAAPAGTMVTVQNLFSHFPARRAAQSSAATEIREIVALVGRYVLHYPQLHWKLWSDGEVKLLHAPSDFRGGVATVYGAVSANRLLTLDAPDLCGVISRPELSRARRDRMHFAINGRPVVLPELERAVLAAYGTLLPVGQSPMVVLNLRVPPAEHNPNVHPTKQVVTLAALSEWKEKLAAAVRATLEETPLVRAAPLPQVSQASLSQAATEKKTHSALPVLQILSVYNDLYLLAEGAGDLWIIDGHAAHERALYEQLLRDVKSLPPLVLAVPELVQLTPEESATLLEYAEEWREWGLEIEDFGAGFARLRSVPAGLRGMAGEDLARQFLKMALQTPDLRAVLARMACLPALRAGHIDRERGTHILVALSGCEQPWTCPHGRPTVLQLSERDLMHSFGRRNIRDIERS